MLCKTHSLCIEHVLQNEASPQSLRAFAKGVSIIVDTFCKDHTAQAVLSDTTESFSQANEVMEFLSRFDHEIIYVKGLLNLVVDCLSHYYENDNWDNHTPSSEMVNIDVRLDP